MIIAAVPACDRSTWPSNQADKYLALFDRVQMFVSVVRLAESTEFELMIENVGPRLYLTRFIHSAQDNTLPKCVLTNGPIGMWYLLDRTRTGLAAGVQLVSRQS